MIQSMHSFLFPGRIWRWSSSSFNSSVFTIPTRSVSSHITMGPSNKLYSSVLWDTMIDSKYRATCLYPVYTGPVKCKNHRARADNLGRGLSTYVRTAGECSPSC